MVNFKIYEVTDWTAKITIHTLPNISRSKDNQAIRFGQLIEYNMRNIFLQKSCRKWDSWARSRSSFVFNKASYEIKASGQHLNFSIF